MIPPENLANFENGDRKKPFLTLRFFSSS